MKVLTNVILIGAWDFGRMKSHVYMKECGCARGGIFWGFEQKKKKLSFL
jgi:hypothetical protein